MTRRPCRPAERATDREIVVVAAVLVTGSEKAAAHRLGLSHSTVKHHLANARSKVGAETTAQLVWILATPPPAENDGRRYPSPARHPTPRSGPFAAVLTPGRRSEG
jgi:DNA-binding CsgD family transcriptional regulator